MILSNNFENSVSSVLKDLAFDGRECSIFSGQVINAFESQNFDELGYQFSQVFEPSVLSEIAMLQNSSIAYLQSIDSFKSKNMMNIAWLISNLNLLSSRQKINLASCLISLSRFVLAKEVLDSTLVPDNDHVAKLEILFLEFMYQNRCTPTISCDVYFSKMRDLLLNSRKIHPARGVSIATQAVVWYSKGRTVSKENAVWFANYASGNLSSVQENSDGLSLLSEWYRAIAMEPTLIQESESTRYYMEKSEDYARQCFSELNPLRAKQTMKTLLESKVKELLNIAESRENALEMIDTLVAKDPNWSPSYGQRGLVLATGSQWALARQAYLEAVEIGFPYVMFHSFHAAKCAIKDGDLETGTCELLEILKFDASAVSCAFLGFETSRDHKLPSLFKFEIAIKKIFNKHSPMAAHKKWIRKNMPCKIL